MRYVIERIKVDLIRASLRAFTDAVVKTLQVKPGATMLTPGIHAAYTRGVEALAGIAGVRLLARSQHTTTPSAGQAALFMTNVDTFLSTPALEDEVFGACSLIVSCSRIEQLQEVAEHMTGQLTATMFLTAADHITARQLLPILERKAGRILVNGFPTGVEVSHAMAHRALVLAKYLLK